MTPDGWGGVRRVLVIRPDNIGDVVMTGPALRVLRRALPGAEIALMASPAGSQAAPLLPWVDAVLTHRPVWQDVSGAIPFSPERERELIERLRARQFDAAVILTSFSQSPYPPAHVCYLAGIPIRLGQSKEFGGGVLHPSIKPPPDEAQQVDRNLHLLEAAGFGAGDSRLAIRVPGADQARADELLREAGVDPEAPIVAIAPGASCSARRYPVERYAEVARRLAGEAGVRVVIVGSERERPLASVVLERCRYLPVVSFVGRTTVPEFAGLVRRAALVIANNSAALHIAEGLRRPMVILYSGTDLESQWRPRVAPSVLLRRPTDCSPCYGFQCPYGLECLDIPPTEVVEAGVRLMAKAEEGNPCKRFAS